MSTGKTHTTNDAIAYQTSGNPIVDMFFMLVRGLDNDSIDKYLNACWQCNPKKTVALIFNARDRVNGKKEKNISNRCMIWLRKNKLNTYKKNIQTYVNKYGCWKDIVYIATKMVKSNDIECSVIANQLTTDKQKYLKGEPVSLCAKWASSENDRNDERYNLAHKIAETLIPDSQRRMQIYRKEYLTPLRKHINIVENYITTNRWKEIQYDHVPAVASNRLKKAFENHDPDGYKEFLRQVACGEKQIKVTGILPHELVGYYIQGNEYNETIEMQWKTLLDNVKAQGVLKNMLAIVDISGSMMSKCGNVVCLYVSLALGLLIAKCTEGPYANKLISFHESPSFLTVRGDTLYQQVNFIKRNLPAGFSTNFEAVFDMIIDFGVSFNIPPENMPEKVVCLSDMQFNKANKSGVSSDMETLHQTIINKYKTTPYKPSGFVYWNLSSAHNETFPVKCFSDNVAMISGFSEQLLKVFMNTDTIINPEAVVDEILRDYIQNIIIEDSDI